MSTWTNRKLSLKIEIKRKDSWITIVKYKMDGCHKIRYKNQPDRWKDTFSRIVAGCR